MGLEITMIAGQILLNLAKKSPGTSGRICGYHSFKP